jgi:hypothetical protein
MKSQRILPLLIAAAPLLGCVGELSGSTSNPFDPPPATSTGGTTGVLPGAGGGAGRITASGAGGGGGTTTTPADGLPCDVEAFLRANCTTCHASTPVAGAPMPLVTYADLTAPSRSNPSMTYAQVAVARMQNSASPMPPAPFPRSSAADITMMQSWVAASYPTGTCGGSATGGSTGSTGAGGATGGGTGGVIGGGTGGAHSGGSSGAGGAGGAVNSGGGLPCDVQTVLVDRCQSCHGVVPNSGAPMSLVTYAQLAAPAGSNPSMTYAQVALARMQSTTSPMPPAPAARATAAEIATMNAWVSAGIPATGCGSTGAGGNGGGTGGGGNSGAGGATASDPFSAPPTCTSKTMYSGGEGPTMEPGVACINCHKNNAEAPRFTIAGTVYPTAHEPNLCNGASGTNGAQVVIIGADGRSTTLTPNSAGNFSSSASIALPFQAKVVYMGRERIMTTAQTTGDCNACHTQSGSMGAPGRILLP